MATSMELKYGIDNEGHYIDYINCHLDLREPMIDGDRMPGCYINQTIDNFIIAKGNILENIKAEW